MLSVGFDRIQASQDLLRYDGGCHTELGGLFQMIIDQQATKNKSPGFRPGYAPLLVCNIRR